MTRAVQHSAKSVEHYGPDYIGNMAREVFGGPINLDPASSYQANLLIRAEAYYDATDDGLIRPWSGNVYLNPPGGRREYNGRDHNQAALWYATLVHRYSVGLVTQALFMVFNLELFRYAQAWNVIQPLEFPICIPKARIDFWKPGADGVPVAQGSPAHPNAVIYMGPNWEAFRRVFSAPRANTDWSGGGIHGNVPF